MSLWITCRHQCRIVFNPQVQCLLHKRTPTWMRYSISHSLCDNLLVISQQNDSDPQLTAFLVSGCGCKQDQGKPCFQSFPREHYESLRMQCAELTRNDLDLILFGQLSALLSTTASTQSHRPATSRQRSSMTFYHRGIRVCRKTFLILHGIGTLLK